MQSSVVEIDYDHYLFERMAYNYGTMGQLWHTNSTSASMQQKLSMKYIKYDTLYYALIMVKLIS